MDLLWSSKRNHARRTTPTLLSNNIWAWFTQYCSSLPTMTDSRKDFDTVRILTITSGTWATVNTDSTRRLQQCIQEQLKHLDNRARALASCAQFESALRDATTMQQLVPSSVAGYLCAGHVYSMQGRQKASIDIYDQGLASVRLSNPSRQQLVEAQYAAQEQDSTVIDFIKELHGDIVENIASRILSGKIAPSEIREYLGVSRVWGEKLLLCVQDLHVQSTEDDGSDNDVDLFEQLAPYCTTFTLSDSCGYPIFKSKAQFQSPYGTLVPQDKWYPKPAFGSVASLLTHLTIEKSDFYYSLGDILNLCPNLLFLQTNEIVGDMSTAPECYPQLKTLAYNMCIDTADIYEITKRLPGLESFLMNPVLTSTDLETAQDNCPKLKFIEYNGTATCSDVLTTTANDGSTHDKEDSNDIIGVHTFYFDHRNWDSFSINEDDVAIEIKDIMSFMIRNSHTLQDVRIRTPLPYGNIEETLDTAVETLMIDHLIQSGVDYHDCVPLFSQMTSYSQEIHDQEGILMARWVARKSPHLKNMILHGWTGQHIDTSALFDDLIGLCELENLQIDLRGDHSMDMGGIERFIQYHHTFDSQLHTLALPLNARLSNNVSDMLATLPRLESLIIKLLLLQDEDADGEGFSQFIHKIAKGCPHLEYLYIHMDGPVADNIFLRLSELEITTLELHMPFYKTRLPMGLLILLQCPQLQKLCLCHCDKSIRNDPSNDNIISMLESKIENVAY
ncbi:hypothetical protein K492DRAFT_211184 [Lichtheimia hyalospora FSU 10163]|nr:hypothetical protein K492DRAFT_211184 [Lichtheimia hyalospora FSU 10163]